ncbi:MAG: GNAT family N-acetyltransferase [Candidatus Heimdallarchaeaceae archaeon]
MEIREIKEEEIVKVANLAEICFHEETKEKNIKIYKEQKDLFLVGLFENNNLLAVGGCYAFSIFIRGQVFSCSGIAHIMTDPIYRRQGYVKKILSFLLSQNYEEEKEISVLWPFNHSFYQKFGFESLSRYISYKYSPSEIRRDIKMSENLKVRLCKEEKDFDLLNQIAKDALNKYTRVIGKHDAWILRGKAQKFLTYIFEKEGTGVGFVTLKFEKPKNKEWENNMRVIDFAYSDLLVKKSIFAFLRNFEADIDNLILDVPPEEEIFSYFTKIKSEHKYATWPSMVRIVNVSKVFSKLKFDTSINTILYANIKDDILSPNNGTWIFKIKDGRCFPEKLGEINSIEKKNILDISIGQLSQLVAGYIHVEKLFEIEGKEIPESWLLDNLFSPQPTMMGVWF